MKNIFNNEIEKEKEELIISDDSFHHFKNVLRGRIDEQVKVFNGKGLIAEGIVLEMGKKSLTIKLNKCYEVSHFNSPALLIGIPKKEYLESILRSAIQIGVSRIALVSTDFTPWKYKFYDRLQKIMESALIQSENPFFPKLEEFASLSSLVESGQYGDILAFSTEVDKKTEGKEGRGEALLIGPEGGFSEEEIRLLKDADSVHLMRCNVPIMKAEVAVPFGLGVLYESMN